MVTLAIVLAAAIVLVATGLKPEEEPAPESAIVEKTIETADSKADTAKAEVEKPKDEGYSFAEAE